MITHYNIDISHLSIAKIKQHKNHKKLTLNMHKLFVITAPHLQGIAGLIIFQWPSISSALLELADGHSPALCAGLYNHEDN